MCSREGPGLPRSKTGAHPYRHTHNKQERHPFLAHPYHPGQSINQSNHQHHAYSHTARRATSSLWTGSAPASPRPSTPCSPVRDCVGRRRPAASGRRRVTINDLDGMGCLTGLSARTTTYLLAGNFAESSKGEIRFPEISTPILEKVIQYLYYKVSQTQPSPAKKPKGPPSPPSVRVSPHTPTPHVPPPGALHQLVAEGAGLPPRARERPGAAHGRQLPRLLNTGGGVVGVRVSEEGGKGGDGPTGRVSNLYSEGKERQEGMIVQGAAAAEGAFGACLYVRVHVYLRSTAT